ncbi:MAG TPA: SseB family protein [Paracoccaceae bacterium]|nr:SseB family protein [Paracoccaceae bacterium]HMO70231.1 SseB family protein [Paracoccaceae bacterium]
MTDATPLDRLHAALMAAPEDPAALRRYLGRLADSFLWVWCEAEVQDGQVTPRVVQAGSGPVVLAFDAEDRLAAAAGRAVPYAMLPGRVVVAALAADAARPSLGVNLGAGAGEYLLPPEPLAWLAAMLAAEPETAEDRPLAFAPPADAPPALLAALDAGLARCGGMAAAAVLARARFASGRAGLVLAVIDAAPGAEAALVRALAETAAFAGLDPPEVTFLPAGAPAVVPLRAAGLAFDLPAPAPSQVPEPPPPPGTQGPPRLRR